MTATQSIGTKQVKRVTVATYDLLLHAMDLEAVLKRAKVDVKLVTKHAVQIHPDHVDRAMAAIKAEEKKRAEQPWPPRAEVVSE